MGLRKLPTVPVPSKGAAAPERAGGESTPTRVSARETDADAPRVYPERDPENLQSNALGAAIGTDLKTPPTLEDLDRIATKTDALVPERSVDAFMASLEALRATLRIKVALVPPTTETPVPDELPAAQSARERQAESDCAPPREGVTSALEGMPLPPLIERRTPTSPSLYQESPPISERKPKTPAKRPEPREAPSMDSALRAVRDAVPGLHPPASPKPDTPTQGRSRPSSDGIPKSVSEDLPKYPARPRMRTCIRCGHETKLRDAKCQKCSHVDESLGILDSLIAGDLARVEQVLLVKPHLITMRTSRHDWTLLHMAASGGNPKMVDLLIDKGVSVNAVNRDGKTALHYAAAKGHAGIVQALLKHLADSEVLYKGLSALDLARKNGRKDAEEALRRHRSAE